MKKLIFAFITLFISHLAMAADGITGFWTTIDDETNEAKSIVQIYEYKGKYYGRVVELLKNKQATAKIPNNPKIEGLDIIWDLEPNKNKYKGGEILDPKTGKVYGCEIWRDKDNLIVRGKIAFLGRNQTWLPATNYQKTTDKLVPNKPILK